jgi:DNA-binding IclR family transcriptional regulator
VSEDAALALLRLLAGEDGVSPPRAAKKLGLGASELRRLLVALGDDPRYGGLGLVEAREEPHRDGTRVRLWLSARGRTMCANARQDAQAIERTPPRGDAT